ncbi:AraC family transcriptional regulator [uncultured Maritalea sp.]|uniref:AraC family transcriptional regulator n=1 Tax=uncultured Maritalea sp. TaxID=757249 RepID=UPI0026338496|nr:AraC family transcriptional regulator [uncultured Maritalea sp.]
MPLSCQAILSKSKNAKQLFALNIGAERQISIWQNTNDQVHYDDPLGHTFSRYLAGGQGTRRLDIEERVGWPGAVCVFPEGHPSHWEIKDPFRFVHLYVPNAQLRAHYAKTHDRDCRTLELSELTLAHAPTFSDPLAAMAQAAIDGNVLQADAAFAELIGRLNIGKKAVAGGLSPHTLRRIDEWVETHLHTTIRLEDLAQVAELSEFHFHRMFSASRGISPHNWILGQRIEHAKALLKNTSIAQISAACGFSSQSHFTRAFKTSTGLTPAAYRRALFG